MTISEDTLRDWRELSRRDDCLKRLVPSDIRLMLQEIDRLRSPPRRDIVTDLRERTVTTRGYDFTRPADNYIGRGEYCDHGPDPLCQKAATEIERLRSALRVIADGIPGPSLFATETLQLQIEQ